MPRLCRVARLAGVLTLSLYWNAGVDVPSKLKIGGAFSLLAEQPPCAEVHDCYTKQTEVHGPFRETYFFIVSTTLLHNPLGALIPAASVCPGWKGECSGSVVLFLSQPCRLLCHWLAKPLLQVRTYARTLLG